MRLVKFLALALAGLFSSSTSFAAPAPIKLLWDASTHFENGEPITGRVVYRIYISSGSPNNYTQLYATKHVYYIWPNPIPNQLHYFRVTAATLENDTLESVPSNEITFYVNSANKKLSSKQNVTK